MLSSTEVQGTLRLRQSGWQKELAYPCCCNLAVAVSQAVEKARTEATAQTEQARAELTQRAQELEAERAVATELRSQIQESQDKAKVWLHGHHSF